MPLTCFKAYDIRGKLGTELNEEIAYRIGRGYAQWLKPKMVVVGGDARLTSEPLKRALARGLQDEGVDVLDVGLIGTEQIYFATAHLKTDGGIVVTASHNPIDYNGMKMVREGSRPISIDTGLAQIRDFAEQCDISTATASKGSLKSVDCNAAYIEHLLGYIDRSAMKPLKIVVNAGNGVAGPVIDMLEPHLPFEFIKLHHQPDGTFPNGIPNPLLPENRYQTSELVKQHNADFGLAWDGDFDRCFFFDESGQFIEGYYLVGLLATAFLAREPGARIVHDPRLVWNTLDVCQQHGGNPVQSKCGHTFIKQVMREQDAAYGGEMSAHHYFRDFFYCDSGMIPWLLIAALISSSGKSLSQLVGERMALYPCSGEINSTVEDAGTVMSEIALRYQRDALTTDKIDGISMEFTDWRFNLRMSNTEPVVRLNVEARSAALVDEKTAELLAQIRTTS